MVEAERTGEHKEEDIPAVDNPAEDIPVVVDIPVVDIPVVDKRPWDIPQMDNLQNSIDPQNQIQTIKFKTTNKQTNKPTLWGRNTNRGLLLIVITHSLLCSFNKFLSINWF